MAESGYGKLSRFNHWFTSTVVITMLAIGLYFHEMPRGDEKLFWLHLHISIGATAWLLVMFRVIWRLRQGFAASLDQNVWLMRLSQVSHWLLLLLIIVMFISGPLTIWSGGRAIEIFGVISIPSPMERMHDLHEWLEEIHAFCARAFMYLIGLHIVGAIWHVVKEPKKMKGRMWG